MSKSKKFCTRVIASSKPWGREAFDYFSTSRNFEKWLFVTDRNQLDSILGQEVVTSIVFLHWNWIVPDSIVSNIECMCLHMTDLPFGRGGSPLQNLILLGKTETKLSIFRMNSELDAGPVYLKRPLSLTGSAHQIYRRMIALGINMLEEIFENSIRPTAQIGEPTFFKRRNPSESEMPRDLNLKQEFDFIRMLDAPTYPRAFIDLDKTRVVFSNCRFDNGQLKAEAIFLEKDKDTVW